MAAAAGEDGNGGEKSTVRWLDVVRYAVAAMVTVVIAAVVVEAIKVVFRRESLTLEVIGNYVNITERALPPKEAITFQFTVHTTNPSGRVRMYYTNITTYLFDNGTDAATTNPEDDCIINFHLPDAALPQLQSKNTIKKGTAFKGTDVILPHFFDILYRTGGELSDVTMRVDGFLVTELLRNSTPALTTYYCKQLLVAVITDEEAASENTAACTTSL